MNRAKRFENKVVIVTGAAQGIGRGVALQVASEGAQVVMADLSPFVEDSCHNLHDFTFIRRIMGTTNTNLN